MSRRRTGQDFPLDLGSSFALGSAQVVRSLQIQPELRRIPEVARKPQRGVCGYTPLLVNNVIHARRGDTNSLGQRVRGHTKRHEKFFPQDFTRVNWTHSIPGHAGSFSRVVEDFDVPRPVISPTETDSPLIIDADTVLPSPVAATFLQPVTRRHAQVVQVRRTVEHLRFSFSLCLERTEQHKRGATVAMSVDSRVQQPSPCERPILPGRFLEAHHHVLRV